MSVALSGHMARTHPEVMQAFQCMVCEARDYTLEAARIHYRRKHVDKPYTCALCKEVYAAEEGLQDHCVSAHADVYFNEKNRKDFSCKFCSEIFASSSEMVRHERLEHLTETVDIRMATEKDVVEVVGDHVTEFDPISGNIIKLHSIP